MVSLLLQLATSAGQMQEWDFHRHWVNSFFSFFPSHPLRPDEDWSESRRWASWSRNTMEVWDCRTLSSLCWGLSVLSYGIAEMWLRTEASFSSLSHPARYKCLTSQCTIRGWTWVVPDLLPFKALYISAICWFPDFPLVHNLSIYISHIYFSSHPYISNVSWNNLMPVQILMCELKKGCLDGQREVKKPETTGKMLAFILISFIR